MDRLSLFYKIDKLNFFSGEDSQDLARRNFWNTGPYPPPLTPYPAPVKETSHQGKKNHLKLKSSSNICSTHVAYCLGIDEDDDAPMEDTAATDDMPPLEGDAEDASRMEEVD